MAAASPAPRDLLNDPGRPVASIIHVSPGGIGSGASLGDPASLMSALERANSGDALVLAAGEYSAPRTIHLDVDGLTLAGSGRVVFRPSGQAACVALRISARDVTVANLDFDMAALSKGVGCDRHAVVFATTGADDLELRGLRIAGTQPAAARGTVDFPAAAAQTGLLLENTNAPRLLDLRLSDLSGTAVHVIGASGSIRIGKAEIINSGHRGIHIADSEGSVHIASNHISGALNEGIYLHQVTGSVLIEGNVVEDIRYLPSRDGGAGIEGGIVHTNSRGAVATTIRRNTVDIDPRGETRTYTGEELLDIDGIEVNLFGSARGFALVEDNLVRNTEDDGIDVDTLDTSELDIVIRNNTITGVHDRSLSIVSGGRSVLRGLIAGNEVTGPADLRIHPALSGDGIGIRPREHSEVHITVRGNKVQRAGRKGIDLNMNRGSGGSGPVNQSRAFFRFEENEVHSAAQRGLDIQLEDEAVATGVLIGNTVFNAVGDGIRFHSGAGGLIQRTHLEVAAVRNDVRESANGGDAGVFARAQGKSRMCLRLTGNHSSNPDSEQDYMIRSQQYSLVELAGLPTPAEAERSLDVLRQTLVAAGNQGRSDVFPVRVRNNAVQPPRICRFPAGDYAPELPSDSASIDRSELDRSIR